MGAPALLRLVELGPGRGTLMADALRAAAGRSRLPRRRCASISSRRARSCASASSAAPRRRGVRPSLARERLDDVPDGPAILVANEFFDALPVRQFVRDRRGLARAPGRPRRGRRPRLRPRAASRTRGSAPRRRPARSSKWPEAALAVADARSPSRLVREGGAALVIDYGHAGPGLRRHPAGGAAPRFADPLAEPGEADLTAHVDFAALAQAAARRRRRASTARRRRATSCERSASQPAPRR